MQQVLSVWSALEPRRRIIVTLATIGMFAAILGVARMASQPNMALLYSGLEPGAAGEVIQSLEQQGAVYDVRGGAIFVDAARRDTLRMTLAGEGLPANGGQGYELLDSLSGFGTTSQMFDAAYWRAKEGELARTIMSSPQVRTARVHIANPVNQPFRRHLEPTASVTVTTTNGAMSPAHANALKYLVSSAVAGLSPEQVSVIDGRGGLVIGGDNDAVPAGQDRAETLRRNVERLIEARVGRGNAVVEVNVDTVTETESILERRFDPDSRVAISSETEESTSQATDQRSGAVTVASNLPDGDGAGAGADSRSQQSEVRERTNYEVSETQREIVRAPGAVRRVSVAVLVDGVREVDPLTGEESWAPRAENEIEALRDLVASAVGFDAERGDTITIRSMEFEPVAAEGAEAGTPALARLPIDIMSLIQLGVLAAVALVLGLFVVRPVLASRNVPALAPPAAAQAAGAGDAAGSGALTGEIDDGQFDLPAMATVSNPLGATDRAAALSNADPVERLRSLVDERRQESVEIIRSWMEEPQDGVR